MDKKWIGIIIIAIILIIAIVIAIVIIGNQKKAVQTLATPNNNGNNTIPPIVGKSKGTRNVNVGQSRRKRSPPATYRQTIGRKA